MLSSPLFWQVQYLVTSLTKKNQRTNISELHQLIGLYGEDARIYLIECLLDDIDFRDQRTNGQKDSQKIAILQDEILRCMKKANFATILCQAFDGGSRQKLLQQGNKLPEDMLLNICKTLKLSTAQTLAFAFALIQSPYRSLNQEALKLLKAKLPEIVSFENMHEDILHGLVQYVTTSEELSSFDGNKQFLDAVKSSSVFSSTPGLKDVSTNGNGEVEPDVEVLLSLSASIRQEMNVASILSDFGPQVSATVDSFTTALQDINIELDEEQVSQILVMVICPTSTSTNPVATSTENMQLYSLLQGADNEEAQNINNQQWNLEVITETLTMKLCNRTDLDWIQIIRNLDQATLRISSESTFQTLLRMIQRISGRMFPIKGLMGLWENKTAQLALILLAAKLSSNDIIDFNLMNISENLFEVDTIPIPPLRAWRCLSVYTSLLEIASCGLANEVLEALLPLAREFPEYITIMLAQIEDSLSGVRTEILRRTLPLFTGLTGSRSSYMIVMKILMEVNPNLLVMLGRIALRRSVSVQDILDVDIRLKSMGDFGRRIIQESSIEELIGYWCVMSDRSGGGVGDTTTTTGHMKLEENIIQILAKDSQNARILFMFVNNHAAAIRPKNMDGGLLSTESASILLKQIQCYPNIVSSEELRALTSAIVQQQQHLGQAPSLMLRQLDELGGGGGGSGNNSTSMLQSGSGNGNGTDGQGHGQQSVSGVTAGGIGGTSTSGGDSDVEEEANAYFQKIYTSDMTINDVITLLKRFKSSTEVREQEIFRCMIHNLFDEYRFFHKYPDKELQVTGRLLGTLIQHQLVSSITLGIALRYVLEALRKDPDVGGSNEKMFKFGKIAIEQFRSRLGEWPQYCSHLVQIMHLSRHAPELLREATIAITNPTPIPPMGGGNGNGNGGGQMGAMAAFNQIGGGGGGPMNGIPSQVNGSASSMSMSMGGGGLYNNNQSSLQNIMTPQPPSSSSLMLGLGNGTTTSTTTTSGRLPMNMMQQQQQSILQQMQQQQQQQSLSGQIQSNNQTIFETNNNANVQYQNSMAQMQSQMQLTQQQINAMTLGGNGISNGIGNSNGNGATSLLSIDNNQSLSPQMSMMSMSMPLPPLPLVMEQQQQQQQQQQLPQSPQSQSLGRPPTSTGNNGSGSMSLSLAQSSNLPLPMIDSNSNSNPSSGKFSALPGYVENSTAAQQQQQLQQQNQLQQQVAVVNQNQSVITPEPSLPSKPNAIEKMVAVNVDIPSVPLPPESVRDSVHFIINNIAKNNLEVKSAELKEILLQDYFNWFASYLVVKRISTQPNLHPLYLGLLDALDFKILINTVLNSVYHSVTKLLHSQKITSSSSERSLLRNLGMWLGQMTIARSRPLLQRRIDMKELLLWGYESGRLIAVCSFVAKIMEGCRDSKVFRPPNPWLMAILSILRELYELDDLKMNIKFEVQVLCKNIGIKIEDIPRSDILQRTRTPQKINNPDFNVRPGPGASGTGTAVTNNEQSSPIVTPMTVSSSTSVTSSVNSILSTPPPQSQSQLVQGVGVNGMMSSTARMATDINDNENTEKIINDMSLLQQEQTVIPNLAAYVTINPSLQILAKNPSLRRVIPLAVDRAIREIIQPVVERSVTIASVTTKQIILKDFVIEPNEQLLRNAAHLTIASLAGSLALVTCKEPLRISIGNHIRSLIGSTISDQSIIEQLVQVCSNDNLDLGCKLIEKAATEKAIRDVDESLAAAVQLRRKARETGQPLVDPLVAKGARYPRELPETLKAKPGGLLPSQLAVYEGFQKIRNPPTATQIQQAQVQVQQSLANAPLLMSPPLPSGMSPMQQQSQSAQSAAIKGTDLKALPPAATATSVTPGGQMTSTSSSPLISGVTAAAAASPSVGPAISMPQALELYQMCLGRVDTALKTIAAQLPGRELSLAVLGGDHEILTFLRDIIHITQRVQFNARTETAMTFAESVFKRLIETTTLDMLRLEIMVGILEAIRDACGGVKKFAPDIVAWLTHYSTFNSIDDTSRKAFRIILVLLLRAKLVRSQDLDIYFATYMDGGRNMMWVELALSFVTQCLGEGLAATFEFTNTFETVSKMRPTNATIRKQLQKWLTDLRLLAASKEEQKNNTAAAAPLAARGDTVSLRDHVTMLLERWLRVWTTSNDQVFGQYLQVMHQYGVLKSEEGAEKFFRIATDLCVEACLKNAAPVVPPAATATTSDTPITPAPQINMTVIDALSKLCLLLVRLADKESSDLQVRVNLLTRILNAIARSLIDEHEVKKAANQGFDQRPYFRLLSNLIQDLGIPDPKQEPNPALLPVLSQYFQVFYAINPNHVPGFAFSWLQLVAHRCFMPHLLLVKGQKGWPSMHRLLMSLLQFLQPSLSNVQPLNDAVRRLYKGTLRVLLVLLHDFPEFLCDYHLSFCDMIPSTCVQLRNLILSAFPRSMRLPDPFTPNLKVDLLPEISQSPRILTDIASHLERPQGLRQRLDSYLATKEPSSLPSVIPGILVGVNGVFNHQILTAIIMHVGMYAAQSKIPLQSSTSVDFFKALMGALDDEGRYHFFNAIANQLRYPNSHTHCFSCVLLCLFSDAEHEFYQEQITRVLLERLIVHRPHPWGLLITFIELIKNPRYAFWRRNFTRCAPEIERVFESVARSCIGPSAGNPLQQQQQTQQQQDKNGIRTI